MKMFLNSFWCLCVVFALIFAGSARSSELVYHWKLDEKYSASVGKTADESVRGSRFGVFEGEVGGGPRTGVVSVYSDLGSAVRFDGIDDGINLGSEMGKHRSDFTVCAWVKPDAFDGKQRILATSAGGWGMSLNGKKFRFTTYGVKDYNTKRIFWFSEAGQWYHLAVYFDENYDCYFYVNGELKGVDEGDKPAKETDRDFYIGTGGRSEFFSGCIDDVRIYKGKLREEELKELAYKETFIPESFEGYGSCDVEKSWEAVGGEVEVIKTKAFDGDFVLRANYCKTISRKAKKSYDLNSVENGGLSFAVKGSRFNRKSDMRVSLVNEDGTVVCSEVFEDAARQGGWSEKVLEFVGGEGDLGRVCELRFEFTEPVKIGIDAVRIVPGVSKPRKILGWKFDGAGDGSFSGKSVNGGGKLIDPVLLTEDEQGGWKKGKLNNGWGGSFKVSKDKKTFVVADLAGDGSCSELFDGGDSWTLNMWVNPERVDFAGPVFLGGVGLDKSNMFEGSNFAYLAIESDSSISMRTRAGLASSGAVVKCGEWQMVTLAYDGFNSCCYLYRNGELVAKKGVGVGGLNSRVSLLAPSFGEFAGMVDEFALYDGWVNKGDLKRVYDSSEYSKLAKKGEFYWDSKASVEDIEQMRFEVAGDESFDDAVRVMSYNIHYGMGTDSNLNLERTAAIILASGADIVGLNEVDCKFRMRSRFIDEAKVLAELTGMNYFVGPGLLVNDGKGCFGNVVLSKYPIVKAKNHLLCHYPGSEQRSCIEAQVKGPSGLLNVFVTHLDHSAKDGFAKQVDELLRFTNGKEPMVLLGDMNEVEPRVLPESGLKPLAEKYKYAFELAGTGVPFTVTDRDCKIDFIFVSPGLNEKVVDCRVYRNGWTDVNSDHYPVVMTLKNK